MLYFAYFFNHQHIIQKRRASCLKNSKILSKLAQNLLSKICANLIKFIQKCIYSQDFLDRNRNQKPDFSRNRKLPLATLILYFCNLIKSSYQPELNKFWKIFSGTVVAQNVVSKAALCKARKKLKAEAFIELNQKTVKHFNEHANPLTWHGFSLKAIDGSTVKLPNFPGIIEHFGAWNPRQGGPLPMARISQLFDPLNGITHHAIIAPKNTGERELAAKHFEHLIERDLVLLDRGYPAFWLFKLILFYHASFCSRISCKKWKIIRRFMKSGRREQVITLPIPGTSIAACKNLQLDTQPIRLRLVRVELESGESEVLITSLIDMEKYPYQLFSELYHDRWPIEEDYKVMKCRIEVENFSGKSPLSVYQDFHAAVLSKNITAMMVASTREKVASATASRVLVYKSNFTQALSTMRDTIVVLLKGSHKTILKIISDLLETITKSVEPVRPGRKYPRNHKRAQRKCCLNYKPIL
jgi:Transposase DDE domain